MAHVLSISSDRTSGLPILCRSMSPTRQPLDGAVHLELTNRERIDWHDHAEHQLIHPSQGVLQVSTSRGAWVVPPHRAVWIPAGVAHAHRAHGPTQLRSLAFHQSINPLRIDRPIVLAVTPLLREVIISLTEDAEATAQQRRNLEYVALDQLRRVDALPLHLPSPADARLRDIADILHADPSDQRTLDESVRIRSVIKGGQ